MKYYFLGIKGAGMSALALILNDLGNEIIGYDDAKRHLFTEDNLIKRNIKIYYDNTAPIDLETIVVRSSAIKDNHPEMIRINELGIKVYEYHEMLGKITNKFKSITIAGCHGKTTTTAMMSHVVNNIKGCNYLIGDGTGYSNKDNEYFILEACEYRRHFLAYTPEYAIITNIELDHVDYFKDIDDVVDAYQEYANNAKKMVIACGDDPYTHSLKVNHPIFFYGISDDNDIQAKNVEYRNDGTSFDCFIEDNFYGHFDLPLYGKHSLLNALAVIAVCFYERLEAKDVSKYLKTFTGAKRRFTEIKIGDIVTVDDYAHHPTEVGVTIKAARQKYPDKKIIAIFQPHTYSRTNEFKEQLVEVLNLADKAYVMDIYGAREKQEDFPGITSDIIINNLNNGAHISMQDSDELLQYENAVIIFMSANDIYELQRTYEDKLKDKISKKDIA